MRKLIILLSFLPLFTLAQVNETDSDGLKQGLWEKKYPNGNLMYTGRFADDKPTGEWIRFHENGKIKAKICYNGDRASARLFDSQGKLIAQGIYMNQKKEGAWKYFNNDRLVSEENFINGLKSGICRTFYETGEILEESEWENGKQEGKYQLFYTNGKPYLQCKMTNGRRNGLCIISFPNGRQELVAAYKNNLRHGEWKYHNEQGDFLYTLVYQNGFLLNPEVRDSIENLQLQKLEKSKHTILDPEKFMENPTEYMTKLKIYN